jgi:hypothetical protein
VFLEKLGGANFLKNIAGLSADAEAKKKSKPGQVNWASKVQKTKEKPE